MKSPCIDPLLILARTPLFLEIIFCFILNHGIEIQGVDFKLRLEPSSRSLAMHCKPFSSESSLGMPSATQEQNIGENKTASGSGVLGERISTAEPASPGADYNTANRTIYVV